MPAIFNNFIIRNKTFVFLHNNTGVTGVFVCFFIVFFVWHRIRPMRAQTPIYLNNYMYVMEYQ